MTVTGWVRRWSPRPVLHQWPGVATASVRRDAVPSTGGFQTSPYGAAPARASEHEQRGPPRADEIALPYLTSGTTGSPKMVAHRHAQRSRLPRPLVVGLVGCGTLFAGAVALFVAVVALVIGGVQSQMDQAEQRLAHDGVDVVATVESTESVASTSMYSYKVVYRATVRFIDEGGVERRTIVDITEAQFERLAPGHGLEIRYEPARPWNAKRAELYRGPERTP